MFQKVKHVNTLRVNTLRGGLQHEQECGEYNLK